MRLSFPTPTTGIYSGHIYVRYRKSRRRYVHACGVLLDIGTFFVDKKEWIIYSKV